MATAEACDVVRRACMGARTATGASAPTTSASVAASSSAAWRDAAAGTLGSRVERKFDHDVSEGRLDAVAPSGAPLLSSATAPAFVFSAACSDGDRARFEPGARVGAREGDAPAASRLGNNDRGMFCGGGGGAAAACACSDGAGARVTERCAIDVSGASSSRAGLEAAGAGRAGLTTTAAVFTGRPVAPPPPPPIADKYSSITSTMGRCEMKA